MATRGKGTPAPGGMLPAAAKRSLQNIRTQLEALGQEMGRLEGLLSELGGAGAPRHAAPAGRPGSKAGTRKVRARGQPVQLVGPRGANARALYHADGLTVLQGSQLAATVVPSMPQALGVEPVESIRAVVRRVGRTLQFLKDHRFPSVSTAAAVVMGRNANGWLEWRDDSGRPLQKLRKP